MRVASLPVVPPGKRFHKTVSPSQVDQYKKCPRRWYNASVLYDRAPTPPFMLKGDAIHKALEHYGKTGEVLPSVTMKDPEGKDVEISTFAFVQAAIPHLAPPANDPFWDEWKGKGPNGTNSAGLLLEQQADLQTWADYGATGVAPNIGPNWTQFIDRVETFPDKAKIIDFKTSSDFRYAKKPAEFLENTQLMANARWLFQNSDYQEVEIGHLYLGTKTKTPKALPVFTKVTRADVDKLWAKDIEIVKEMVTWAAMNSPTADPLPPNTSSCGDYGGCYYREKCGFDKTGTPLVSIRSFAKTGAPEVSTPPNPIVIPQVSKPGTPNQPVGATSMDTNTQPGKGGLLATLMAAKKAPAAGAAAPAATPAPAPAAAAPAPSASTAPATGLVAPKASPFAKPAAAPAPVVGVVVPATGTAPAPAARGGGLAGLFSKKAPAAAPEAPAPEAAPGSISPPDASPATSTPEEVAAANPEPAPEAETPPPADAAPADAAPADAAPKRRGRPKKTETPAVAEVAPATAAQSAPESSGLSEAPAAESSTLSAPETAPAPADATLEAIRAHLRTADPNFACPVRFLFVDCLPGKGWPAEHAPEDLNNFMHGFQSTAASNAGALDYRLIKYEQKAYLCMAIRVLMKGLPVAVHVNTSTPGAAEFLAEVTPYAEMIFRATR